MTDAYKVLILEDDEFTVMAYKRMFSKGEQEMVLTWCKSVVEAKEHIKADQFDAVVLDYQLPDGDAFELMPLVENTPIIFVSGMEDLSIAVNAMRQGAFDYLVKDFNHDFVQALPLIIEKAVRNNRIEVQLLETEQRYSDLFQYSNDLIQSVNMEGHFLHVNPAWLNTMEYTMEEVMSLNFLDIIQPEEHEHCKDVFKKLMQGHSFKNEEIGFLTKSGKRIYVEGNIFTNSELEMSTIGIFRDVTERKESEKRLIESKERYDLAVDAGKTGVVDWDLRTNRIFIDDKLKSLIGYGPDEIENSIEGWHSHVHPDYKDKAISELKGFIVGQIPKYDFEYKMIHKDGSERWILGRAKAIRDENNKVLRLIGTGTDVTIQKRIQAKLEFREEELRSINENLEDLVDERTKKLSQSNKHLQAEIEKRKITEKELEKEKTQRLSALIDGQEMERKRFSQELHDSLGQLLTAAKLQVRQVTKRVEDGPLLETVKYTGEILDLTMQEVRRISHALMPVLLNDFGLPTALEKVIEQLNTGSGAEISFNHREPSGRLSKDIEIGLYRICQEALNNSLKYANCSYIQVILEQVPGEVTLTVSDDGKGMSEEVLHKVYHTPSGNGIYNMRERAELIHGSLTLESSVDKGTKIQVTVPL